VAGGDARFVSFRFQEDVDHTTGIGAGLKRRLVMF